MANRQTEVPGTEGIGRKKVSKKAKGLIDDLRDAINARTKANTKARDAELAARAQLKEEGVTHYVDTEAEPPIEIDLRVTEKVVIKKHKPEKPKGEGGDGEGKE